MVTAATSRPRRHRLRFASAAAVRAAVLAGAGPAAMSRLAVSDHLIHGRLRAIPVGDLDLRCICAPFGRARTPLRGRHGNLLSHIATSRESGASSGGGPGRRTRRLSIRGCRSAGRTVSFACAGGVVGAHAVFEHRCERGRRGGIDVTSRLPAMSRLPKPSSWSSARAPPRVPRNSTPAGCIGTPASPGSATCTLKASPSTRGIRNSLRRRRRFPRRCRPRRPRCASTAWCPSRGKAARSGSAPWRACFGHRSSSTSWQCTECAMMVRLPSRDSLPTLEPGRNLPS